MVQKVTMAGASVLTFCLTSVSFAQNHFDVLAHNVNGAIAINKINVDTGTPFLPKDVVFTESFLGASPQEGYNASAPGFNSTSAYSLLGNSALTFSVEPALGRNLSWWSGSGDVSFAAPPLQEAVIFGKNVGPNVRNEAVYSGSTNSSIFGYTRQNGVPTSGLGGLIDTTDSAGRLHRHVTFFLRAPDANGNVLTTNTTTPSNGIYLLTTKLHMSGLADSEPYYVLFSLNASGGLTSAKQWVNNNLVNASSWVSAGGGSWSVVSNWSGVVPDGSAATANFGQAITAPSVISLGVSRTIGAINFSSLQTYTIAGPGTLTLAGTSGTADVNLTTGNHLVSSTVALPGNLTIASAPATDISFTGTVSGSTSTITKAGNGNVNFTSLDASAMNVQAGVAAIVGVAKVKTLTIAGTIAVPTAKISLGIGAGLILDHDGVSPLANLKSLVSAGLGTRSASGV